MIIGNQLVAEIKDISNEKHCVDGKNLSSSVLTVEEIEPCTSDDLHNPQEKAKETYNITSDVGPG